MTRLMGSDAAKAETKTSAKTNEPGKALALNRRQALVVGASLPMLATLSGGAAAEALAAPKPLYQRFALGAWQVIPLLAGMNRNDEPRKTFGLNVSDEDFARVSAEAFIPADWTAGNFIPVLLNTGSELVLFDTGIAAGGIVAALAAVGVAPSAINVVVLTHMHGDHIGGLTGEDGSLTFPNARYVTGRAEYDHWAAAGNAGFDAKVKPLAEKMTFLEDGGEAMSGVTAVAAFGHTPGHMAWHLEQDGMRLMLTADAANHYIWSLQNPDWEVRFDLDKSAAAATRRKLFGMIAADRLPFIGYHMPFPGIGYVEAAGEGFRYHAHSYQLADFS